ncbi:hypothetical protein FO519_006590 [Halicephalobus sp. NKZ332]|nr:hypothetical protein FO519_006590 [Halicephalobus sp. NKZ332]
MSEYSLNFSSVSSNLDAIRVKWDNNGLLHRFSLEEGANFAELLSKVQEIDPDFVGELGYTDDEGDLINFSSTVELHELIAINRSLNSSTIKIKTIGGPPTPPPLPPRSNQSPQQNCFSSTNTQKEIHPGIICDNCDNSIFGIRYKCIVCDDFDLCENCEKKGIHSEHGMLRRANPRTPMPAFIVANRIGFGGRRRPRFMQNFEGRTRPKCPRRREDTENHEPNFWERLSRSNYGDGFAGEPVAVDESLNRGCPVGCRYRNENRESSNLTEAFRSAMERTAGEDQRNENRKNENKDGEKINELNRASEAEQIPLEQENRIPESGSGSGYNDPSEILRNCITRAYQTAQQAISQATSVPPAPEAPPAERLAYNAAQAAQIAVAGLATASETLQRNVSILARDVENPHFKEAMNQLANVLAATNSGNGSSFPRAPASTPANVSSPMNNTDPTTTPAEPQHDQENFDTVMEAVSKNLNVVDLSNSHNVQKDTVMEESSEENQRDTVMEESNHSSSGSVGKDFNLVDLSTSHEFRNDTVMEESTHTAIDLGNDENVSFSLNVEKKTNQNSNEEMVDSMMDSMMSQMTRNENFYDAPESMSPTLMEDDNKTSVLSDIEVISMRDDEEDKDERDILNPSEPRVVSDGQVMLDAGDGWMVLSQGSYEEMCRFYEAQRRQSQRDGQNEDVVVIVSDGSTVPSAAVAESNPQQSTPVVENTSHQSTPVVEDPQPTAPVETPVEEPQKVETAPQPPPRSGPLYPKLEEQCEAGTPYYQMTNYYHDYQHTRQCPIEHPNAAIQAAVDILVLDLGFDNCNGWITHLSEKCNGEIDNILSEMEKDPIYIQKRSR